MHLLIVSWLLLLPLAAASWISPTQETLGLHMSRPNKELSLTHDLVKFHQNLTQIESITGNEKEVGDWLTESLESQGYRVRRQSVDTPHRFNVYAWPGSNRYAPTVLLTSHIDTVPPFYPYKMDKSNGKITISGRGSVDAKASVAAQVIAVNKLLSNGKLKPDEVGLLFVVGEEVGGEGMRKANDLELHAKTIIFGEPTEGKLVSGHKGNMIATLNAKGKAAHSGYPWLGRSANEVLVKALASLINLGEELPKSDKYGTTTLNLGLIEGGVAGNVVAESASAKVTVRIAAGTPEVIQEAITKAIHNAVKEFVEDDMKPEDVIEIDFGERGYAPIDIDHDVPGLEVMTVNYGTDIPWLKKTVWDQKRYLYGPGSIMVAHSDHEALTRKELREAVDGYTKIILHALDEWE